MTTRLFRSKSCGLAEFNPAQSSQFFHHGYDGDEEDDDDDCDSDSNSNSNDVTGNPISTPFISPASRFTGGNHDQRGRNEDSGNNQYPVLDILLAAIRKSLVTCSVETDDVSSVEISWPTEVKHVSHVTFDRFNGFLGLPTELEPELPRRVPSASANVFGVSAKSMQCAYDGRGNSVPSILLLMQKRLYAEGGLKAEGIFRINPENSQEEIVRSQLNRGLVPFGIDVHCLAGLIKAWFRELPNGVLDSLAPEQVMHCNTENDCTQLVKSLPPTESALLDWAINLMVDVVQHEEYNKMNARNIAMVFAPNMTQMADPLTALIHAVQVMNLLKTLILKNLREREEAASKSTLLSSCSNSPSNKSDSHSSNINKGPSSLEPTPEAYAVETPRVCKFLRATTLGRLEADSEEKFWSFKKKNDEEEEFVSVSDSSPTALTEIGPLENRCRGEYDNGDWLSLRKGVRKLCRHPVFQLSKPATKKTRETGIVNTRRGSREAWT